MNTETIDKLFLELSQVSTAKTFKELTLTRQLDKARKLLEKIVITEGKDAGVIMLSNESSVSQQLVDGVAEPIMVYDHEFFSPLGDALMEVWQCTR